MDAFVRVFADQKYFLVSTHADARLRRFDPTATDALPDLDVLIERFRVHLYTLNARRSSVLMCINDAEARTGLIARN
jgi:hypothetical protein